MVLPFPKIVSDIFVSNSLIHRFVPCGLLETLKVSPVFNYSKNIQAAFFFFQNLQFHRPIGTKALRSSRIVSV